MFRKILFKALPQYIPHSPQKGPISLTLVIKSIICLEILNILKYSNIQCCGLMFVEFPVIYLYWDYIFPYFYFMRFNDPTRYLLVIVRDCVTTSLLKSLTLFSISTKNKSKHIQCSFDNFNSLLIFLNCLIAAPTKRTSRKYHEKRYESDYSPQAKGKGESWQSFLTLV